MKKWLKPAMLLMAVSLCGAGAPQGVQELPLGTRAPDFSLPGTDGRTYSFDKVAGSKGTLIIFTCDHCPVATAYQDRLIALANKYTPEGIGMAAICCNDAKAYPEDSFEGMKKRAAEKKFPYPYLRDESESVAVQYGPKVTPHVFLFDSTSTLVYRGRVDDAVKEPDVTKRELTDALDALVAGKQIPTASTIAFGCSIKWRPDVRVSKKN